MDKLTANQINHASADLLGMIENTVKKFMEDAKKSWDISYTDIPEDYQDTLAYREHDLAMTVVDILVRQKESWGN